MVIQFKCIRTKIFKILEKRNNRLFCYFQTTQVLSSLQKRDLRTTVPKIIVKFAISMTGRNYHYDRIRATAIIFVILIHSCGILLLHPEMPSAVWVNAALTSLVNTAVPLFLMLSGTLLLGKEEPLGTFLRKRFSRILLPFVIWSLVFYLVLNPPRSLSCLWDFPWKLLTGGIHGIYWFVYMIIGLYLLTPLLRPAMRDCTLGLWTGGLVLVLFLVHQLFPRVPFVEGLYMPDMQHLLCYVGGFLLVRHLGGKKWLGPVSLAVAVFFYGVTLVLKVFHPVEFPFAVITAFGLFGWMITLPVRKPCKVVTFLSETSYGIYLCHAAVISVFVRFAQSYLPVWASPFLTGAFTLVSCAVLMWFCKKLKLQKVFY